MRTSLIPHPTSTVAGLTLEADVRHAPGILSLEYRLSGPVSAVRWPDDCARERTDELWRTTCFEAFARTRDGYVEYNLSPSGAWAAYRFDGYREGMRDLETAAPLIVFRQASDSAALTVDLSLPDDVTGPAGLTTVIEMLDRSISYWALSHPSDIPDFHNPDSFILGL